MPLNRRWWRRTPVGALKTIRSMLNAVINGVKNRARTHPFRFQPSIQQNSTRSRRLAKARQPERVHSKKASRELIGKIRQGYIPSSSAAYRACPPIMLMNLVDVPWAQAGLPLCELVEAAEASGREAHLYAARRLHRAQHPGCSDCNTCQRIDRSVYGIEAKFAPEIHAMLRRLGSPDSDLSGVDLSGNNALRKPYAISIVIAARNAAASIERTIGSVAMQELPALEVILVDDNSSDETVAVAQRAACEGDVCLRVISNARQLGAYASRTIGIASSKHERVAILDADDLMLPGRIIRLAKLFGAGADVVQSKHVRIDANGVVIQEPRFSVGLVAFRKDVFYQVGGYADVSVGGDAELLWRLRSRSTIHTVDQVDHLCLAGGSDSLTGGSRGMWTLGHIQGVRRWFRHAYRALPPTRSREGASIYQQIGQLTSLKLDERVEYAEYLDVSDSSAVRKRLAQALGTDRRTWVIPFARTSLTDSVGERLLVRALSRNRSLRIATAGMRLEALPTGSIPPDAAQLACAVEVNP